MRTLLLASVVLFATPAFAADRAPLDDDLYACLVGRGAVELHYGVKPEDAITAARKVCADQEAALDDPSAEGDPGDEIEAIYIAAQDALKAIAPGNRT